MASSRRTAVKENRSPNYEARLASLGFDYGQHYEYVGEVPIDEIERHPDSQARIRMSGASKIKEYAEKSKNGELFPPTVVWADSNEGYDLLDGNTRVGSWKSLHRTHIHAYVITSGIESRDHAKYLSAQFNLINGVPLDTDEKMEAIAAALRVQNPPTHEALAKQFGIATSRISGMVTVANVEKRAEKLGLDISAFPADVKKALVTVADNAVFIALVSLIIDAHLNGSQVRELVNEINRAGSESGRLQVVAEERAAQEEAIILIRAGRRPDVAPMRDSLMALGRLVNLIEAYPDPAGWVPLREDKRLEWLPKIQQVSAFLDELVAAYQVDFES